MAGFFCELPPSNPSATPILLADTNVQKTCPLTERTVKNKWGGVAAFAIRRSLCEPVNPKQRGSSNTHSHNSITKAHSQVHLGIASYFLLYSIELSFFLGYSNNASGIFVFFLLSFVCFTNLQTECIKWVLCLECLIWLRRWIRNEFEADMWQVSSWENSGLTKKNKEFFLFRNEDKEQSC